jgi:hypothetical protein
MLEDLADFVRSMKRATRNAGSSVQGGESSEAR